MLRRPFFSSTLSSKPRAQTEKEHMGFAKSALGTDSLEALRAKPADEILQAVQKSGPFRFSPNIDGYFLPEDVLSIYAKGKQSHIPLLAGWNADEGSYRSIFGKDAPAAQNFAARARALFGDKADAFLKLYPAATDAEAKRSAQDLAGDQFIAHSTWKWLEMHQKTGNSVVYRYEFDQTLPVPPDITQGPEAEPRAPHAAEIEYVFQVLTSRNLPWRTEDRKISALMGAYWTNFAKAGDPNGEDLPQWPAYSSTDGYHVMHLSASPHSAQDQHRGRYEFLDSVSSRK